MIHEPLDENDTEIRRLIDLIFATEHKLVELTKGEVDSVALSDGRTLLLRGAQDDVRQRDALKQATMLAELRVLFDLMPAMIWFKDVENNILRVNQKVADAAKLTVEEIEGHPSVEIYPTDAARFYADDLEVITSGVAKLGFVERLESPGNEAIWVQTDKVPYFDQSGKAIGIIVVATDVTEGKRAESHLLFKEQRFRSLVEATAAIVWSTPASGEFEVDQPKWRDFTGQTTEELMGWGWLDAVHPGDQEETSRVWIAAVATRSTYKVEHRLRTKDNTYRNMLVRAVPILSPDGEIIQWMGVHTDISDLKRAEESLRLLASAVEQAKEAIMITDAQLDFPGPHIVFSNPAYSEMTGFSAEEALGKTPRLTHGPETDQAVLDQLRTDLLRGQVSVGEAVHYRKDGSPFLMEWQIAPLTNDQGEVTHFVSLMRDMTEKKRAEAALRESEDRFRAVLENVALIACIVDANGVVTFCNDYLLKLTGWDRESVLGSDWLSLFFRDSDRSVATEVFRGVNESGAPAQYQTNITTLDGRSIGIQWNSTLLHDATGKPLGIATIGEDVTERNLADAALKQALADTERQVRERTAALSAANAELVHAVKQADSASRAKSEFLSSMSHELRTPMNSVLGYAQLLYLQSTDPKVKDFAHLIVQGGKHLLEMINEILDLAQIESGVLSISLETVHFSAVLDQALGLLQPIADAAGIRVMIEWDTFQDLKVEADRQRLFQVVINLLGNAIKFNRPNGYVSVRRATSLSGSVRIEIQDNGTGISVANQALLFQPFQRFGNPTVEGTGLGLALSQRFMVLMRGQLGLSDSSPAGSTFYIELQPVEKVNAVSGDVEPSYLSEISLSDRQGTVLYIEDNEPNIALMQAVFARSPKLSLLLAKTGTEGIELARDRVPDLILLDVRLPDIFGNEVLSRLKRDPITSAIPVVMVSADATHKQAEKFIAEGADAYMTKPIDITHLLEILKNSLPRAM